MSFASIAGDALIVLGTAGATLAVVLIILNLDAYRSRHAANLLLPLGVVPILAGSGFHASPSELWRLALAGLFLVAASPVAAHAIARAVHVTTENGERKTD